MSATRNHAPWTLLLSIVLPLAAGCGRGELVAGPAEIGPAPLAIAFHSPVTVTAPDFGFCFEFDRPGDSVAAIGLELALVTADGRREPFHAQADRVGERDVCWRGSAASKPPVTYRAIEITNPIPARVREIRFVPGKEN